MYWLKNNWFILLAILLLCFYFFIEKPQFNQTTIQSEEIPLSKEVFEEPQPVNSVDVQPRLIKVDIKGEIKKPGLYEMEAESRVDDLINKAGGLTEKADYNHVNLAQKLVDEMSVYIPATGERMETSASVLSSGTAGDQSKVRINSATLEEIMTLNGIGAKKAEAILAYREENGPFTVPEDLLEVSGIGERTLENIIELIQVP